MNKSFQEKSILISLVTISLIFGYYFLRIFRIAAQDEIDVTQSIVLLVSVIVMVVIVEIVFHIILALTTRQETKDERDRLIELKAIRNAYFVLAFGIFLPIACIAVSVRPFIVAHVIMFTFVVSEIAGFATQLFYYRRGI
ncbi:MAG: hypothetical protein U9Q07_07220 [Planctomycetota bacterium]|nr:hypothetical protein [Planctomycetota bacterium]